MFVANDGQMYSARHRAARQKAEGRKQKAGVRKQAADCRRQTAGERLRCASCSLLPASCRLSVTVPDLFLRLFLPSFGAAAAWKFFRVACSGFLDDAAFVSGNFSERSLSEN